jgi:hypothetical protein
MALQFFETRLTTALLALVIDLRWSNATLTLILNETDETRRNELLGTWVQHRFADLERINITVCPNRFQAQILILHSQGVLVAGVISSAFSWYNITSSPWSTRALWYCGLLFALAAITTAGVHSAGLHRLGCHPDWHAKLQQTLGVPVLSGRGGWRPRTLQPVMWQTPGFLLKLSITSFLIGLIILVWDAARRSGVGLMSDDMKVCLPFRAWELGADSLVDCDPFHGWRWCFADTIHDVGVWSLLQDSEIALNSKATKVSTRRLVRGKSDLPLSLTVDAIPNFYQSMNGVFLR